LCRPVAAGPDQVVKWSRATRNRIRVERELRWGGSGSSQSDGSAVNRHGSAANQREGGADQRVGSRSRGGRAEADEDVVR
jgi:hypothetical protein